MTDELPTGEPLPDEHDLDGIVDFARMRRRLAKSGAIVASLVLVGWVVVSVLDRTLDLSTLAESAGFGVLLMVVIELVVVGGGALRGMLRAGERGHRLSSHDVSLLPPRRRK